MSNLFVIDWKELIMSNKIFGNKSKDDDRDHVNDDHANKKDTNEKTRR